MRISYWAVLAATLAAAPLHAQEKDSSATASVPATTATLSDGEVRRGDKAAKKITIRHGPLANLDMPAMTMVFQVKDSAMLDQVKVGDKVKFAAEKQGGAILLTRIELAQ